VLSRLGHRGKRCTCPAPGPVRRAKAARASGGEAAHTAAGGRGYSSWSRRLRTNQGAHEIVS